VAFSAIGTGLTLVTARLTNLIASVIVVLNQTGTPDIERIKSPKFGRSAGGTISEIGASGTGVMTRRTDDSDIIIKKLSPTLAPIITKHSQGGITRCTLWGSSHTLRTGIRAFLALFIPSIKITTLAHTQV
jgi:hypothetical protein